MSAPLADVSAKLSPLLVIEDEPAVSSFLRAALERHGYAVVPATSAAEGIRLLRGGDFCGVISDIRTPGGMNGADIHEWIYRHRPGLASRVIFITGDLANPETLLLLQRAGAPCIEKPVRLKRLLAIVAETIGKPIGKS